MLAARYLPSIRGVEGYSSMTSISIEMWAGTNDALLHKSTPPTLFARESLHMSVIHHE